LNRCLYFGFAFLVSLSEATRLLGEKVGGNKETFLGASKQVR
jgi:hypothetical protein